MTETLIKLPYQLKRVIKQTSRLHEILLPYAGRQIDGESWEQMVKDVRTVVPGAPAHAIRNSLRGYIGLFVSPAEAIQLAQLLAGNEHRLLAGQVVIRWLSQAEPEWVPVHVLSFEPTETRERKLAGLYRLKVLAGTPCPLTIEKVWPSRFVPMLARRLGYTGRRGGLLFSDISELVNLCLVVQIDPRLTRNSRPGFDLVGCTSTILARNRKVIQKRFRRDGAKDWPCPQGYSHRCYQCPVGYDRCPAATHAITFGEHQNAAVPGPTS